MITYETVNYLKVKLDGKVVGEIKAFGHKYAYIPKGSKTHGELYSTVAEVKKVIEAE